MSDQPSLPDAETAAAMLEAAIGQIQFARNYTLELLDATPRELWLEMPSGLPTHIAWQVGHLAVSEYGLLMFRIRGRQPEDLELISSRFRKAFSRQSMPQAVADAHPSPDDLLDRLSRVHDLALTELASIDPQCLLEPVDMPYAAYPIKLGAIMFCSLHEQIHDGQIGLLRRALELEPIR